MAGYAAEGIVIGQWTIVDSMISFSTTPWSEIGVSGSDAVTAAIRQIGKYAQSEPLFINIV
jgi:hypothetical protein